MWLGFQSNFKKGYKYIGISKDDLDTQEQTKLDREVTSIQQIVNIMISEYIDYIKINEHDLNVT